MLIIVLTVANDVIIGAILPYIHAVFLVTKSFEVDTNRDGTEFCTVGTGVLDGPFPAPFTHSII